MDVTLKRIVLALAAGLGMALVVWLNLSESSPLYDYLRQDPAAGYGLMILNLPALFLSRLLSGTPPAPAVVYLACFVQWFALGIALSFAVWRGAETPVSPAASRRLE